MQHNASADFLAFSQSQSIELCAPALLFPEIASALARPSRNPAYAAQVVRGIRQMLKINVYTLDTALAAHAEAIAREYFIRGADAFYGALAERLQIPLITLDRELLERGRNVFDAMTPADWIAARPH